MVRRGSLIWLAVAAPLVTGCQCVTVDPGALFLCESDGSCPNGLVCQGQFCVDPGGGSGGGGGSGASGGSGGTGGTGGAGGSGGSGGGAGVDLVFNPSDDATISELLPDTNFGADNRLDLDHDGDKSNSVLKFTVSGIGARTITKARLRLLCGDGSDVGGTLWTALPNTWLEGDVTWNTAPAIGTQLSTVLNVVAGSTYDFAIPANVIAGDGVYSFRLTTTSNDQADFHSKEGSFRPALIIAVQ